MISHVGGDLYQVGSSVSAGNNHHEAVRVYLLKNQGRPILIDAGSHLHRAEFMAQIGDLLDGGEPECIFLSHSELPHSGNLQAIVERWPDITIIVSTIILPYTELQPVYRADKLVQVAPNEEREFAGRQLRFFDGVLKDQPGTQWIFDAQTGTLFSGDAFGYDLTSDILELFSDQIEGGIGTWRFAAYHRDAFKFLRWVDAEMLVSDLRRLLSSLDLRVIAPAHGNAIRGDIDRSVEAMLSALHDVARSGQRETG